MERASSRCSDAYIVPELCLDEWLIQCNPILDTISKSVEAEFRVLLEIIPRGNEMKEKMVS